MTTLDEKYDSYGYKEPERFVSLYEQNGTKYPPVKRVEQHYTEIGSFISNAGQPTGDLVWPMLSNNGNGE